MENYKSTVTFSAADLEKHKMARLLSERAKQIGVFTHLNPDADGLASMLVGAKIIHMINKDADIRLFCQYEPTTTTTTAQNLGRYRYLFENCNFDMNNTEGFKPELCVAFDCADLSRLGKYAELFKSAKHTGNIDHHQNTNFADINLVRDGASCTCELLYNFMQQHHIDILPGIAAMLYAGVITDTADFTINCNANVHRMAANLYDIAKPQRVKAIFNDNTKENLDLLRHLTLVYPDERAAVGIVEQEHLRKAKASIRDTLGLSDRLAALKDIDIAMVAIENAPGNWHWSLRANNDCSIAQAAHELGGGYSSNRVGAFRTGDDPFTTMAKVVPYLKEEFIRHPKKPHQNPFIDNQPLKLRTQGIGKVEAKDTTISDVGAWII